MNDTEKAIRRLFLARFFVKGFNDRKSADAFLKAIDDTHKEKGVVDFEVVKGVITKLVCARRKLDTLGRTIVEFYPCHIEDASPAGIRKTLLDIRRRLVLRPSLAIVRVDPRQRALMRGLVGGNGFIVDGNILERNVDVARSLLHDDVRGVPAEYSIVPLSKRDMEPLLGLGIRAHRSDKSSRLYDLVKTREGARTANRIRRKWLAKWIAKGDAWGVHHRGKIVGAIAIMSFPHEGREIPLITTIEVDPDHQGIGLSKLLYYKALGELKKRGATCFYGATTTDRILRSKANSHGRVVRMALRGRL